MKRLASALPLLLLLLGCPIAKSPSGQAPGTPTDSNGGNAGDISFGSGSGFTQDGPASTDGAGGSEGGGSSDSGGTGGSSSGAGSGSGSGGGAVGGGGGGSGAGGSGHDDPAASPNTVAGSAMGHIPKGCQGDRGKNDTNDKTPPITLSFGNLKATSLGPLAGTDNIIVQAEGDVTTTSNGTPDATTTVLVALDTTFKNDPNWRIFLDNNNHFIATIHYAPSTTFYWRADECDGTTDCWQLTIKEKSADMRFTTCPVEVNPIFPIHPRTPPDDDLKNDRPPKWRPGDDNRPLPKSANDYLP